MTSVFELAFTPLVLPRVGEAPVDVAEQANSARVRGYADGFAEGRKVARVEAQQQADGEQLRADQAAQQVREQAARALEALRCAEREIAERTAELASLSIERIEELAIELAELILGAELSDAARSAAHAWRRANEQMPPASWTHIALNPQDVDTLMADEATAAELAATTVTRSNDVDAGGALIELEHGAVDARVTVALARAVRMLRGEEGTAGVVE